MKKPVLFFSTALMMYAGHAQKCMQLNIVALMGRLEAPGGSASSFNKCNVTKNDEKQTVIVDYGTDLNQLDTMLAHTSNDFNRASLAGISTNIPSQNDIDNSKQLAEKLKNMTPEQQKQWAMQVAREKQKGAGAHIQDDAQTTKLVFQVQDMAVNQLKKLNDEFAAKLRDINSALANDVSKVKMGSKAGCPQDKTGLPSCGCANEIAGKYWAEIVKITDRYNDQRTALLQSYIPRIKSLVATVDDDIVKLKYGDAVQSPDLKRTLFSSQAASFSGAFDITTSCIKLARKDGSNAYLNKFNSDHGVYDLSCYQ